MPAHRIAILYGSASPSGRLLHERLTDAGVAFNGPGSRPVAERALVQGRSRADRPRSAPLASRADESTGIAAADARRLARAARGLRPGEPRAHARDRESSGLSWPATSPADSPFAPELTSTNTRQGTTGSVGVLRPQQGHAGAVPGAGRSRRSPRRHLEEAGRVRNPEHGSDGPAGS